MSLEEIKGKIKAQAAMSARRTGYATDDSKEAFACGYEAGALVREIEITELKNFKEAVRQYMITRSLESLHKIEDFLDPPNSQHWKPIRMEE